MTDEQVAIFRHTEIQTLLRKRRRQREAEESDNSPRSEQGPIANVSPAFRQKHEQEYDGETESINEADIQPEMDTLQTCDTPAGEANADTLSEISHPEKLCNTTISPASAGDNTSRHIPRYANLNASQRKNMKARRRRKKQLKEERRLRQQSEAKTPRRIAREQDEFEPIEAHLDYDKINAESKHLVEGSELFYSGTIGDLDQDGKDKGNESDGPAEGTTASQELREKSVNVFQWPNIKETCSKIVLDY